MTASHSAKFLNLGCGPVFVSNAAWINLDFQSSGSSVRAHDLLLPLPFPDNSFDLLYSSHFLEHVPRQYVSSLLREWRRVLKPNGIIRLVLPDCIEMFTEYLKQRHEGCHDKADFVILEIIDQCVRSTPGGLLQECYADIATSGSDKTELINYIHERTGEIVDSSVYWQQSNASRLSLKGVIAAIVSRFASREGRSAMLIDIRTRLGFFFLPRALKRQNLSYTAVGEKHQWLWDFPQLSAALVANGFKDVKRQSHQTSSFEDFPFYPLDALANGLPRKGKESMYIEAVK